MSIRRTFFVNAQISVVPVPLQRFKVQQPCNLFVLLSWLRFNEKTVKKGFFTSSPAMVAHEFFHSMHFLPPNKTISCCLLRTI